MQRTSPSPDTTFDLGRELGRSLRTGDVVLLYGGLGAGKTLFTKGILDALDYDVDEVTSPSFALVNLYKTEKFDVYHIDLWRVSEGQDAVAAVGLDEILETGDSITIVEWAERLGETPLQGRVIKVTLEGDGDEPRTVTVAGDAATKIVVRKSDRSLELHCGGTVKTYDIALGFAPDRQKSHEGDGRTPEGEFYVFAKNPKSGHHLSLALSYPNVDAATRGLAAGTIDRTQHDEILRDIEQRNWIPQETPLGGRIYIHGGGTASDWTDGCIAVSDEDMAEIFEKAEIGTSVTISA